MKYYIAMKKSKNTNERNIKNSSNKSKSGVVITDRDKAEYIPHEVLKKSEINQLLTIYLEYKIMILLRVDFVVFFS